MGENSCEGARRVLYGGSGMRHIKIEITPKTARIARPPRLVLTKYKDNNDCCVYVLNTATSTIREGFALWGFSGVFQPFLGHNLNISLLISDVIPLSGRWSCRYLPESQRQNLNQGKNK